MNKQNMIYIGIIIVLLILGLGYTYRSNQHQSMQWLTLYGNVEIREVMLSFRVPGRIQNMFFDEGDHVNQGVVLAQLDTDTFNADLTMAKARLAETLADEKNAELTFERRTKLVATGAVEKSLYDDAIAMKDKTKALVDVARMGLEKAHIALNDTAIHAPTNGTILTRVVEPGAIVGGTQAVYTLAIDNPVWVRTYVSEPDLGRIYPGQKALIYTDSNPQKPYQGQVGFISPQAEFTPKTVESTQLRTALVYRFRVIVANPDKGLRQGMPVTIQLHQHE